MTAFHGPLNALREFKRRTKAQEAIRKMQSARGLAERLGGLRPGGGSPMRGSGMTVGLDPSARAAEETNRRPATPTPGSMPPPAESGTPTLRPPSPSEVRSSGRRSPMAPSAPTPVAFGSAPVARPQRGAGDGIRNLLADDFRARARREEGTFSVDVREELARQARIAENLQRQALREDPAARHEAALRRATQWQARFQRDIERAQGLGLDVDPRLVEAVNAGGRAAFDRGTGEAMSNLRREIDRRLGRASIQGFADRRELASPQDQARMDRLVELTRETGSMQDAAALLQREAPDREAAILQAQREILDGGGQQPPVTPDTDADTVLAALARERGERPGGPVVEADLDPDRVLAALARERAGESGQPPRRPVLPSDAEIQAARDEAEARRRAASEVAEAEQRRRVREAEGLTFDDQMALREFREQQRQFNAALRDAAAGRTLQRELAESASETAREQARLDAAARVLAAQAEAEGRRLEGMGATEAAIRFRRDMLNQFGDKVREGKVMFDENGMPVPVLGPDGLPIPSERQEQSSPVESLREAIENFGSAGTRGFNLVNGTDVAIAVDEMLTQLGRLRRSDPERYERFKPLVEAELRDELNWLDISLGRAAAHPGSTAISLLFESPADRRSAARIITDALVSLSEAPSPGQSR